MYKSFVVIGGSVENPGRQDPERQHRARTGGRKATRRFEERCRQSCADAKDVNALKICVNTCSEEKNPRLSQSAEECDTAYVKEQGGQ